jgi:phage replication initiation protein
MDTLNKNLVIEQNQDNAELGTSSLCSSNGVTSIPPSGNTGGKFKLHINSSEGESFIIRPQRNGNAELIFIPQPSENTIPFSAITDYLNCTFRFDPKVESLPKLFQDFFMVLGVKFAPAIDRGRGLHGYKHSYNLGNSNAMFALGGQAGTAFLSLPGEACSLVKDWQLVKQFLEGTLKAKITRWDGAVDDIDGFNTVNNSVELYLSGAFNAGGNKPSCNLNGNWIEPDGKGRTFYVGKRKNGKLLRVYEKGMQLGTLWDPWVRWEVELHNKDRIIPKL